MRLEPMIYSVDLHRSINFYTEILGFEIDQFYPDSKNPTWVRLRIGEQRFAIGKMFKDPNHRYHPSGILGSGVHFYVIIDDVESKYRSIKEKLQMVDNIELKPWGSKEFAFKDPDGYLISIADST